MRNFISSTPVNGLPYYRTEHSLLPLTSTRDDFVRAAAEFFVQQWMSASLPTMLNVWQCWNSASLEEKRDYLRHFTHLLNNGMLVDNPAKGEGETDAMATFSETMLRWLRKYTPPLIMEPPAPVPPSGGNIDLIEITGKDGDYTSMQLTMWEVKSSENQISGHNSKIRKQLASYPKRFFSVANSLAERHRHSSDTSLLLFLKNMSTMVENGDPQVHYGVFVTYDPKVPQKGHFIPDLHKYPSMCSPSGEFCHHLDLFLVPDFKQLRMDVWQCLYLV